jgi:hypothetical protein
MAVVHQRWMRERAWHRPTAACSRPVQSWAGQSSEKIDIIDAVILVMRPENNLNLERREATIERAKDATDRREAPDKRAEDCAN